MPLEKEYENCGDLDELIQKIELEQPDKKTKEYSLWLNKINLLYMEYNKLVKFKCYKML